MPEIIFVDMAFHKALYATHRQTDTRTNLEECLSVPALVECEQVLLDVVVHAYPDGVHGGQTRLYVTSHVSCKDRQYV